MIHPRSVGLVFNSFPVNGSVVASVGSPSESRVTVVELSDFDLPTIALNTRKHRTVANVRFIVSRADWTAGWIVIDIPVAGVSDRDDHLISLPMYRDVDAPTRWRVGHRVGDEIVTLSAGLAARPPHGSTGDELMRAADSALSRCKRSGRNQVGIFIEDKMVMKSNYYSRATLDRLSALSRATNRTEASLLREAADMLLAEYAGET